MKRLLKVLETLKLCLQMFTHPVICVHLYFLLGDIVPTWHDFIQIARVVHNIILVLVRLMF